MSPVPVRNRARADVQCALAQAAPRSRLMCRRPSCACPRTAFFLGGVPTLKHKEVIASPTDRFRLQTEPSGEVHLSIGVLTKDFVRNGVSS